MYPFPVELWTRIFRHVGRRDLNSTATTCRTFRKLAQAQVYRDVTLSRKNESIIFGRILAEHPEVASLVFRLTHLIQSNHAGEDKLQLFTSCPVLRHISSFSNLCSIYLLSIYINSGICAALQDLPRLQELGLDSCEIDADLDAPQTQMEWGHNLSSVIILDPSPPEADWIAVIPQTATALCVFVHPPSPGKNFSLKNLLSALMLRCQSFKFTSLALMNNIPSITIDLLNSCPQLKHVIFPLPFYAANNTSFPPLPSDSLPLLEHFSGCATHLEAFITGRRIHSVDIEMIPDDLDNALISLGRSLIPVTKMQLMAPNIKAEWLRYIPLSLRSLKVDMYDPTGDVSWVSSLPKISTLFTLHIVGARFPTEQQLELVDTASAMFNSLREFVFEWMENNEPRPILMFCTWRWRQELPWECYIDMDDDHAIIHMQEK